MLNSKSKLGQKESRLNFYTRWHGKAKPYFLWQLQQFKPYLGNCILDVGCGLGNFTEILLDRKLYIGIDLDLELIKQLKMEYSGKKNIELFHLDVTEPEFIILFKNKKPNSILCVNLLEHIEDDINAIRNMIEILPTGGYLCLLVPAFQFLYGTLDSLDGHFRRYNKNQICKKLKNLPLEVSNMYYFNFIGGLGWLFKGKILLEKTQSNANYYIMNLLIPIVSKIENLLKPPFGISLIVILKKK